MSYTAQLSRANPGCFIFLIDQSGSMDEPFGNSSDSKAFFVATAMNRLIKTLVLRCAKGPEIRDYFEVGVIGYGENVGPAFIGPLRGREIVPISELGNKPDRMDQRVRQIPDGLGGLVEEKVEFPVWFDPVAYNGTPMTQALELARRWIGRWISQHPASFPPIVINITDGEADTDPRGEASRLVQTSTNDGYSLLFNVHISAKPLPPVLYPSSQARLADPYAEVLFEMSSSLPDLFRAAATDEGYQVDPQSRAYIFNGDGVALIKALQIGTATSKSASLSLR